jgi:alcohol dehydrogenase
MADFRFHVPSECFVGNDAIFKIPLILGEGIDRAVLVADPDLKDAKSAERLITVLEARGVKIILFDDLDERPTSAAVESATAMVRGARAPLIIGLGGIRAIHAAKAIAALAPGDRAIEHWMDGEAPTRQPLPLVLIPTSYRDPFIMSGGLVLGDARSGQAVFLQAQKGIESAIVLDVNLLGAPSAKAAAAALLDGVMCSLEGFMSSKDNFLADMALQEAIALYIRALDVLMVRPDDPQAKADAARAFFLSGLGLASSSPGLGSAVSYAVNARWNVPKANMAAVLLPYLFEFLTRSKLEKAAVLAPLFCDMDPNEAAATKAARAVEALRTRLGVLKIPSRLKDFDLELERLIESAETARRFDFMNFLPRAMTVDDVFDFIKTVY